MSRTTPSRFVSGELALIESIRGRAAAARCATSAAGPLRLGIGDDCAVLRPSPGHEIVVTTDFSLEGRHFRRDWHPPQSVGHRCLARGLSDLAAMGARPLAIFLSLALPRRTPAAWVERFLDGFLALAGRWRVPLAGGDTAQSPPLAGSPGLIAMDIVAVGEVRRGQSLLRSGARPGDAMYVTGPLGGAAAELLLLEQHPRRFRRLTQASPDHPHLYPQPRLDLGRRLARLATAAIDLSDGLSTDLTHLCRASGVSAVLDEAAIPLHPLAVKAQQQTLAPAALSLALHGGEDYELLFTAPSGSRIPSRLAGISLQKIGVVQKAVRNRPAIVIESPEGQRLPVTPGGWEHFR